MDRASLASIRCRRCSSTRCRARRSRELANTVLGELDSATCGQSARKRVNAALTSAARAGRRRPRDSGARTSTVGGRNSGWNEHDGGEPTQSAEGPAGGRRDRDRVHGDDAQRCHGAGAGGERRRLPDHRHGARADRHRDRPRHDRGDARHRGHADRPRSLDRALAGQAGARHRRDGDQLPDDLHRGDGARQRGGAALPAGRGAWRGALLCAAALGARHGRRICARRTARC